MICRNDTLHKKKRPGIVNHLTKSTIISEKIVVEEKEGKHTLYLYKMAENIKKIT